MEQEAMQEFLASLLKARRTAHTNRNHSQVYTNPFDGSVLRGRVLSRDLPSRRVVIQQCVQSIEINRLTEKVITAFRDRRASILLRVLAGNDDDRNVFEPDILSQTMNHSEAV